MLAPTSAAEPTEPTVNPTPKQIDSFVPNPLPSPSPSPSPAPLTHRDEDESSPAFRFTPLPHSAVKLSSDKHAHALFAKWGMSDNMTIRKYAFDQHFASYAVGAFLRDLFDQAGAAGEFQVIGPRDTWCATGRVTGAEYAPVRGTKTDTDMLKKLYDYGILRPNGAIAKCLDTMHPSGLLLSDLLRLCLFDETSDEYATYTASERDEMLFRVFRHVVGGGRLCQYEDEVGEYVGVARKVYRELVSVTKNTSTTPPTLSIPTLCYTVTSLETSLAPLFPMRHPQNFCYVTVDPARRVVTVWYHASSGYY
ncbi:hypothetical protein M427DRAFT_302666 [Gonapodya prolifera JEL478]|uniref:Cilia- and flagella-associated protein 300 n=1 Tax=Gonapodya prolifera (strain JEL478) TaxID=1344416 RepID=A0A139AHH5_GONPJ|nr:hypothetical protein M427DRAFT_302666 [Gonapodya prolifera JEL478]|eukprot:KXS16210.1 hypothetical protein M427DRAFT_302666 [Gonapodya prolifera JEL478]